MKNKRVCGVGFNDADYIVMKFETVVCDNGKQKRRHVWGCPYYMTWCRMLGRSYSQGLHKRKPTYTECSVVEDWHIFSNFRKWMVDQSWEGKSLDKDLLIPGNKMYSPETCVFVTRSINNFITDKRSARGNYPLGVCWHKRKTKFQAHCCNPFTGKREHLGYFDCADEAHNVWKAKKCELANMLAAQQTDPRVTLALQARYLPATVHN